MKRSLAILALSATALLFVSCSPTIQQFEFKYAEKRATLPNGLKLVVIPDTNTPMAQVNVRYEVGSNEDPPGKRGLAHLAEHMLFQHRFGGPQSPPTFELLPMISPGGFNAYTTWEKTHYHLMARAEDVEPLVRLEAARMNHGCKDIPEEQFTRELEVVRNEIRQRTGGADGQILSLMLKEAYPEGHAYREYVGGNDEQLSNIQFKDVCDFLEKYYTPDRATVVIIGNVDVDKMGTLVSKYFGGIPAKKGAERKIVEELQPFEKFEKKEFEIATERTQAWVVWRFPKMHGKDRAKVNVLSSAMNAKLNRFREQYNFAASVGAGMFDLGGASGPMFAPLFVVNMELNKASDLDEALGWVWKAAKSAHRGVTGEGFDEVSKNLAKARLVLGLESISARADRVADLIQFGETVKFNSESEYLFDDFRQIDEIDGGGFKSFVKGRLEKSQARVLVFKASESGIKGDKRAARTFTASATHSRESTTILDPKEANRPLNAPETKSILDKAERYELGNGMKVILLPVEGMPVVTSQLMFRAGAVHEDPNASGLARLAAGFRGPPLDSDFWQTGVNFFGDADADSTTFYARGINIYLGVMMKGLDRIIKAGHVSQPAIESWQKRTKTNIDTDAFRQNYAFGREFASALYGPEHPYVTTGTVTEKSIGKMGMDRLRGFASKHYSAGNATLIVAGNFDAEKAKSSISDAFGGWGKGRVDEPVSTKTPDRSGAVHFGVIGKEHPQVQVRIGYPGPAGIDDKFAARRVLSGMLSKRMAKVRSQLGSTYGIAARWSPSIGPSSYQMGGSIDKSRAGESVAFMRKQLDELRAGVDFERDFAEARRAVLKGLLAESSSTLSLSTRLANAALYNLPADAHDKLVKQVAALTMDDVKAVIAIDLDPKKEVLAALGDREALEAMFSGASLNDARFIEPK